MSTDRSVALGFVAAALILFAIVAVMVARTRRFMATARAVDGTVIGHEARSIRGGTGAAHISYFPVVTFVTAEGQPMRFTDQVGGNRGDVGGTVPVRYDPMNPTDARIASGMRVWFAPALIGVFAVAFAIPAAFLLAAS